MNLHRLNPFLSAAFLACLTTARADMVIDWNITASAAVKTAQQSPAIQHRFLAIVHAAIFDAVNGINRRYEPYLVEELAPGGARQEAAPAQAAYTALTALFPAQKATFDARLAESLGKLPGHQGKSQSIARGQTWGEYVAQQVLAVRNLDGFYTPTPGYFGGTAVGQWRSLPTAIDDEGTLAAIFPQLVNLVPWGLESTAQFRPGPPPALTSVEYANAVNEVKAIGAANSTVRTPEQTLAARLWHAVDVADENAIVRQVAPADNSLVENAWLFAMANFIASDTILAGFDAKYKYNLWRPYHAIRLADADENPLTEPDPNWTGLILAPRHQEYFSNHSVFTGGLMYALAQILGDDHTFVLSSPGFPDHTSTYHSFSEAAAELGNARIWAGVHYRFSTDAGREVGIQIAQYLLDTLLLPLK